MVGQGLKPMLARMRLKSSWPMCDVQIVGVTMLGGPARSMRPSTMEMLGMYLKTVLRDQQRPEEPGSEQFGRSIPVPTAK